MADPGDDEAPTDVFSEQPENDVASEHGSQVSLTRPPAAITIDESMSGIVKHVSSTQSISNQLDLEKRIRLLEQRLLEQQLSQTGIRDVNASQSNSLRRNRIQGLPEAAISRSVPAQTVQQPVIPQIRERGWFDFMNKFLDEGPEYAIEALTEQPDYELQRTSGTDSKGIPTSLGRTTVSPNKPDSRLAESPNSIRQIPDRVRINSRSILRALKEIDDHIDEDVPSLCMMRPFKFFIHHEKKIQSMIKKIEDSRAQSPATIAVEDDSDADSSQTSTSAENPASLDPDSQEDSLAHLR